MSETLEVPKIGKLKKDYVIAGVAVVGGVVGYAWWRHRTDSAAAVPTPAAPTGDYVNPNPGVTSGSQNTNAVDPNVITTNDQWTTHALDQIARYTSYDAQFAAQAIGKWLGHIGLTTEEKLLIITARGLAGEPPVGGPYPMLDALPIPKPSPEPVPVPVPDHVPGAPTGASARPTSGTTVDIWWQPVAHVRGYTVWLRRKGSNDVWTTVGSTFDTNITARGLTPNTAYETVVRANNEAGYGPYSATVYVTTTR